MKRLIILFCIFSSCKEFEDINMCSTSPLKGLWYNSNLDDTLQFKASCEGTSNFCSSEFTYSNSGLDNAVIDVDIYTENGHIDCLQSGEYRCEYLIEDEILYFDCGTGISVYER